MSKKETASLLAKARRSVKASERHLQDGDYDFAVSRAYYGRFYVGQDMLLSRNVRHSEHSGVIAAFQEQFVKSGDVPSRFFHLLRDGFEDRAGGDCGFAEISRDRAEGGIEAAQQFVDEMAKHLD